MNTILTWHSSSSERLKACACRQLKVQRPLAVYGEMLSDECHRLHVGGMVASQVVHDCQPQLIILHRTLLSQLTPDWAATTNQRCSPGDHCLGLETTRDWNFAVLVLALGLQGSVMAVSGPINKLLACIHRKIVILFAQVNNKDCHL